jgi:endonuclease/exonuclease/phosphatase family metal-dependent hydrolase
MPWWLTNVYGPTNHADKDEFMQELRNVRSVIQGPWMLCGDFNMIYQTYDKSNGRLHRSLMRRFRQMLDDLQLDELHLSGRLFTWSNHRDSPTMERRDRVFASVDWLEQYNCHHLRCLSSDYSDHAPLLLVLNSEPWGRPRFRFDE